jgi:enterochelin esterase family protein
MGGPEVDADGVTFALPDAPRRLAGVRLWQEVRLPGDQLDFGWADGVWLLRLARPAVGRMEYLLELCHADGRSETIPDPSNPRRVGGAFGDHSVVEFPDYTPPSWLDLPADDGTYRDLAVPSSALGATVHLRLWSSAGLAAAGPAPLLVVHDGPEYDRLAALTRYLAVLVKTFQIPPVRVALLAPGERNAWYSADPRYASALCTEVLPTVDADAKATRWIAMGASLGGLAALHAHRTFAGWFDGLFLQSASFFHPVHDAHESRFAHYPAITEFVRSMIEAGRTPGRSRSWSPAERSRRTSRTTGCSQRRWRGWATTSARPRWPMCTTTRPGATLSIPSQHPDPEGRGHVRREHVKIPAPAAGGEGNLVVYGHYGRPVLVFPSEAGPPGTSRTTAWWTPSAD